MASVATNGMNPSSERTANLSPICSPRVYRTHTSSPGLCAIVLLTVFATGSGCGAGATIHGVRKSESIGTIELHTPSAGELDRKRRADASEFMKRQICVQAHAEWISSGARPESYLASMAKSGCPKASRKVAALAKGGRS
jgi:hypothetical protein